MERGVRGGRWSLAWLMTLSESELPPPSIVARGTVGEPVLETSSIIAVGCGH